MDQTSVHVSERHYGADPFRPDIHGILIPGRRGRILSVLYTAGGPGPHPAVLLCHGIPGCERNLDLAQALRRAGFHVMTFHYSGSWGSDGAYALRHDLEDAETVLDFLLADDVHGIDKSRIYAAGHSMGGFVCGQITARRKEIQGGVLLTPCDIGRLPQIMQEAPQDAAMIRAVLDESAPWLTGVSGEALAQEAIQNSADFRLEQAAAALAAKPVLCVEGTLDPYTPAAQHTRPLARAVAAAGGTQFRLTSYPTDHFFSDYRLEISQAVCRFLAGLAGI